MIDPPQDSRRGEALLPEPELNMDGRFRVDRFGGIAFYLLGYKLTRDEDYEWTGIEEEDRDWVRAVMVGDDHEWLIETDELEEIDRESYCPDCGQIGCKAYG